MRTKIIVSTQGNKKKNIAIYLYLFRKKTLYLFISKWYIDKLQRRLQQLPIVLPGLYPNGDNILIKTSYENSDFYLVYFDWECVWLFFTKHGIVRT